MRRFWGENGSSSINGSWSALPETRMIRSVDSPAATSVRRLALARSIESSQLV